MDLLCYFCYSFYQNIAILEFKDVKMLKNAFGRGKVIVVGDVHGDLNQLMIPLIRFLKSPDKYRKLVFLGDYIDRGESNAYIYIIITFIRSLAKYSNQIVFLRGNHECYPTAIRDYYNDNWKTNNWDKRFIESFVYNSIHDVEFDIVNYDQELNVVFSHSPLSRPLVEVLKMNETKTDDNANVDNTFTDDSENAKMEYKNIHGHIHRMSSDSVVDKFANNERKMISVDGDASYGITLVQNFMSTSRKALVSHVQYLVIHDKNDYDIVKEDIAFFDYEHNYNLFKFEQLKRVLSSTNSYVANQIDKLKFAPVIDMFTESFVKAFNTKPKTENIISLIRKGYDQNIHQRTGSYIYFHDVPIDVYNSFGLFVDESYNEIGKLFWCRVLGLDNVWKRNYICSAELTPFVPTPSLIFIRAFVAITIVVILVVLASLYIINNAFRYRQAETSISNSNEHADVNVVFDPVF